MADLLLFGNVFVEKKKRNYRERIEMTDLSDTQIRSRFRFRRDSITYISDIVRYDLQRATKRSQSISVEMQVLVIRIHIHKIKTTSSQNNHYTTIYI